MTVIVLNLCWCPRQSKGIQTKSCMMGIGMAKKSVNVIETYERAQVNSCL